MNRESDLADVVAAEAKQKEIEEFVANDPTSYHKNAKGRWVDSRGQPVVLVSARTILVPVIVFLVIITALWVTHWAGVI